MLGPNFFNFLQFFFKSGRFPLLAALRLRLWWRLPLFRWWAVVGWLCPDASRRRGRAERLAISPFLYAISTLEKLFNLSASLCFSMSIKGQVAERFENQTFQNCSTLQRAGVWLVPLLSPPCPPFVTPSAGVALFRSRLLVFQLRRLIFQSRDYFSQSLGLWGSIHR